VVAVLGNHDWHANRVGELDRDDAGNENDSGEKCCELYSAHGGLLSVGEDVR
jgi:hypothetical protein